MPSAAARSPSRIGPDRSTVASAASWVGVSPASSCLRRRRDSRASATRSLVTSTAGASAPASSGAVTMTDSVLTFPAYAVRAVPWFPAKGGNNVAMGPSVSYSITVRLEVASRGRAVSGITRAVEQAGGVVTALDVTAGRDDKLRVDVTCAARGEEHSEALVNALAGIDGVTVHKVSDRTFLLHLGGKIEMRSKVPLRNRDDLSMAYTPGVGRVAMAIAGNREDARRLTVKRNSVAVVTDGSAVLGLGNIGPYAALPVMEGKAALFKRFADIDAWPICLDSQDSDEIVRAVELIAPGFGGINLEDISAPRCFEIEERLKRALDIPVFHDDQHGTAVVVMAAVLNAVKLTDRRLEDLRVLIIGLGAAGIAVTKILLAAGVRHIVGADSQGALHTNREDYLDGSMNAVKRWFAQETNPDCRSGTPEEVIDGEDLLIGVSGARALPAKALARMSEDAMVFAMANPNPEINPEEAAPYVRIIATGRSDYPNQINNVLCFPGIFRGALDVRARTITEEMKMTAAYAIAQIVDDSELREDYIIPSVFNRDVAPAVAAAVAEEARAAGTARAGQEVGFAQGDTMTGSASGESHAPRTAI